MGFMKNISIKWKILVPIIVLSFLLLAACIQANVATDKMIELSMKIAGELTESTTEVEELLTEQNNLYQGIKSSNTVKIVIAVIATIIVFIVAIFGVIKPLLVMNNKLNECINGINEGKGDLTQRVEV